MSNAQTVKIDTPLGKLCACAGGDTDFPEIFIYIERNDGVEIDLTAVEVKKDLNCARAYLWGDTATDAYTNTHTWSKEELNIKEW